jgi:hypothetical protein
VTDAEYAQPATNLILRVRAPVVDADLGQATQNEFHLSVIKNRHSIVRNYLEEALNHNSRS